MHIKIKYMRKHVIFLLLALSVASMQAQEFQWAKGWTSGDNISGVPSNTIVKSLFGGAHLHPGRPAL